MPRVLIAPDKFKGCLTGTQVADAVGRGMGMARAGAEIARQPVADGGDGTLDCALSAGYEAVDVTVAGPTGERLHGRYARRGPTATVELAAVSGLAVLPGGIRQPLTATSRGTGDLVRAALDAGAERVVVGLGGSACTDGGAGMVQALGARLTDRDGRDLASGGAALWHLDRLDLTGLHPGLTAAEIVVASDVDNPLTGPAGAAAVYGPQKGADPEQVAELDRALSRWADVVAGAVGVDRRTEPGAGAAGGVGFAALALLGATVRPGIEVMMELLGLPAQVRGADLVVVGEGSLDEQSLHGKAPVGVARIAREAGARVVAVCGRCEVSADRLAAAGIDAVYPLSDLEPDPARSMARAAELLERVGAHIAAEQLTG